MVTIGETWLYHYDAETKRQLVEWRHSGSPSPKKFRVQKSAGRVLVSIFWDRDGIRLIDYLSKDQTINAEYYSSLLVLLKDILKENAAGESPSGSCSCTTMPRLTGHLQPRRNWPTWASNALITHPNLTEKISERSQFFFRSGGHCCRGDLVGRTNFLFF